MKFVKWKVEGTCWEETRPAENNEKWVAGIDGTRGTEDDKSLLTDNFLLKQIYPNKCGSQFGCDIVEYKLKSFAGHWSDIYLPGVNDTQYVDGIYRNMWAYFTDHTHWLRYCNLGFNLRFQWLLS